MTLETERGLLNLNNLSQGAEPQDQTQTSVKEVGDVPPTTPYHASNPY